MEGHGGHLDDGASAGNSGDGVERVQRERDRRDQGDFREVGRRSVDQDAPTGAGEEHGAPRAENDGGHAVKLTAVSLFAGIGGFVIP